MIDIIENSVRRGLAMAPAGLLLGAWSFAAAQGSAGGTSKGAKVQAAIREIEDISAKAGSEREAIDDVFERSQGAIGRIRSAGVDAIPEIERLLSEPARNWKVKAMSCEALGKINAPESADLLQKVLADSGQDEFVRAVAGHALASMRRGEKETFLKQTVSDASVPIKIRARIMMAVGQVGLEDVAWLKRAAMGEGLGLPGDKHAAISQDEFGLILNAQRALGASTSPQALDAILDLADQNPGNPNFIKMLGQRKNRRAVPVLIKALKSKPRTSTGYIHAAIALGNMRATEAVDELLRIVKDDPDPILVAHACEALAKIGDKKAVAPIESLIANMKTDPRFNEAKGVYWQQEIHGNGPIATVKRALSDLKK